MSASAEAKTMVAGEVENPVLDARTYDPAATLADVTLPEGWAWDDATVVPTVKVGSYAATLTLTSDDLAAADYSQVEGYDEGTGTVKRLVALQVNKALPTVTKVPSASGIVFGQSLSDSALSDGEASVSGSFAWADATAYPSVVDSNVTDYDVVFAPDDDDNYTAVTVTVKLEVAPKNVADAKVSVSVLPQEYTGSPLEPGATVVVDGKTLVVGTDYELVDFVDNIEIGTASFTVVFKGNYAGETEGTFVIEAAFVPGEEEKPSGDDGKPGDGSGEGSGQGSNGSSDSNPSGDALAKTGDPFASMIPVACGVAAAVVGVLALSLSRRKDQRF